MNQYSEAFTQFFYNLIFNLERVRTQLESLQNWFSESDQHIVALDKIYQIASDNGLRDQARSAYDQLSNYEPTMKLAGDLLTELIAALGIELPEVSQKVDDATSEIVASPTPAQTLPRKRSRRPKPILPAPTSQGDESSHEIEFGGRNTANDKIAELPEEPPRKKRIGAHGFVHPVILKGVLAPQVPETLEEVMTVVKGPEWPNQKLPVPPFNDVQGVADAEGHVSVNPKLVAFFRQAFGVMLRYHNGELSQDDIAPQLRNLIQTLEKKDPEHAWEHVQFAAEHWT